MIDHAAIRLRYEAPGPLLDDRARRRFAAAEAVDGILSSLNVASADASGSKAAKGKESMGATVSPHATCQYSR